MDLVASEPVIRQPVDLHFDDRGRLWVVQYLQYPFPAGLTITSYDQYLRARYNAMPAAPSNHVRGADKITVLEDTNGDGTFDSHKDVITGLNITTSVLTGHGGVWVMNPPHLLFYRDSTGDGLPDGDPEVRLVGIRPRGHALARQQSDLGPGRVALRRPRQHEHGAGPRPLVPRSGGVAISPRHRRVRAVRAGRRQSLDALLRQQGPRVLG